MRHCTAGSRQLTAFDGHGSRYVDDVRSWQTDEPALDMTGAAVIAAAAQLRLHPHAADSAVRPGTPRLLRGINDRAALDLLLEHGPLSRTRLGELTGLSKPTASQLLARLERAGLVVASGSTRGGPGPRAQLYAVNPDAGARRRARRHPGPDRRRRRRHHRPHRRRARAPHPAAAGAGRRGARACTRSTGAAAVGRARRARTCATSRSAPPAPSTRAPGGCATPATCPAGTTRDLLDRLAEARRRAGRRRERREPGRRRRARGRAAPRGVDDFVLLWADEGLGAAIVIDGRLHGGATGGAGEVGFLPLPGTPLVRDVRRGNAGGFQELAGGTAGAGPGPLARPPRAARRRPRSPRRSTPPGAGDELLAELGQRFALGIAAMVAVLDPALVVLSGGVLIAGGDRAARPRSPTSSARWPPPGPGSSWPASATGPVLAGALHTALTAARDDVFDTVRHPPPTRAAPGPSPGDHHDPTPALAAARRQRR